MKKREVLWAVFLLAAVFLGGNRTALSVQAAKKTAVTLNYSTYDLKKGKSVKLKASVKKRKYKKKIVWKSSNPKVATVNQKGRVKGKKEGTAKITAKIAGTKYKAVCRVKVKKASAFKKKRTVESDDVTITQYSDASGSQAMFYTIEAKEFLYVVDGGWTANADKVRSVIQEKGGKVSGWILTHPHPDHIGAFNAIFPDPQGIEIEKVYAIDMDYALYKENAKSWDGFSTFETFCQITGGAQNLTYLHTGDILGFPGFQMEVFNAYDATTINYSTDLANVGSMVFKITGKTESMLFCGDIHGEAICEKIMEQFGDRLKSTYLQMGHHGNNSVTEEFISFVSPKAAFFDAPQWLIEGEQYDTQENINYVQSMGAGVYTYLTVPNQIVLY